MARFSAESTLSAIKKRGALRFEAGSSFQKEGRMALWSMRLPSADPPIPTWTIDSRVASQRASVWMASTLRPGRSIHPNPCLPAAAFSRSQVSPARSMGVKASISAKATALSPPVSAAP